jgi:Glycosyl hydrolases family 43
LTVHDKPFGLPHNEHNKHATSQAVNAAWPLTVLVSATVAVTATNKGIITRPGPPKSVGIYDVHVKKTLVPFVYLADPSARVVDGKLIVYCSHDIEVAVAADDDGSQFGMTDYRILSFNDDLSKVTDHGSVLPIETVPWVKKQLWAPDAVCVDGKCYLYFPAKDKKGLFRIGVATSESPYGPFVAEKKPISSSYSIDPAVLVDDDGIVYLYFGGLWGGQLQNWMGNKYKRSARRTTCGPALKPRVGRLKANMKQFVSAPTEMPIVDAQGNELDAKDHWRRFFEGAWVHKRQGRYYLSYSTGDTHLIAYATSSSPTGPWAYQGVILSPPVGWTSQVSIVDYKDRTLLFYHDSKASGNSALRNVKMQELHYTDNGDIVPMTP